jgi:hypothetical protein
MRKFDNWFYEHAVGLVAEHVLTFLAWQANPERAF